MISISVDDLKKKPYIISSSNKVTSFYISLRFYSYTLQFISIKEM